MIQVAADRNNLVKIRRFIAEKASILQADPNAVADLILAVDEAVANVIIHGYQERSGIVEVEVGRQEDALIVWVRDHASAFDPTQLPSPDVTAPLESRTPGGLGVYLMRRSVDEVTHRLMENGQNELTLIKKMIFC